MTKSGTIQRLNFSLAYEYAELATRALKEPDEADIRGVETDFLSSSLIEFYLSISKPHKRTLLHNFIWSINSNSADYETGHLDPGYLIEKYGEPLTASGATLPKWFNETELSDHIDELDILIEPVINEATDAAFQILFSDRAFLYRFQEFLQPLVRSIQKVDSDVMKKNGVVKRHSYIPAWLKNAIFHRDKGRCQLCFKDITGLFVPTNDRHMDHMIALEDSGNNDPTNFQLLCTTCNTSKGKKSAFSKPAYAMYW